MEVVSLGSSTRYFVMAATPSRFYTFQGTGSLEVVFKAYSEGPAHFTELPGGNPNSELQFYGKQPRAERFAWLAGPGIYHDDLNFGTAQSANHDEESNVEAEGSNVETVESNVEAVESNVIDEESMWLLEYSKLMDGPGPGPGTPRPFSLALSEFHFVVLMDNMLKVVNRVSQKVVEEQRFDTSSDLGSPTILGLCSDVAAEAYYAYDENSIFAVSQLKMRDATCGRCTWVWKISRLRSKLARNYEKEILCILRWHGLLSKNTGRRPFRCMQAESVVEFLSVHCLSEAEENQTLLRGPL